MKDQTNNTEVKIPLVLLEYTKELGPDGVCIAMIIIAMAPNGGDVQLSNTYLASRGTGRMRGKQIKEDLCRLFPRAFSLKTGKSGCKGASVITYNPSGLGLEVTQ